VCPPPFYRKGFPDSQAPQPPGAFGFRRPNCVYPCIAHHSTIAFRLLTDDLTYTMSGELQAALKTIILSHLGRLERYEPGHGRGTIKLTASELRNAFSQDPVYSIFGLDSGEYIAAALAGGTVTSIHRKLGDADDAHLLCPI